MKKKCRCKVKGTFKCSEKVKLGFFFPVQVSIFEPLDSKSKKVPFLDKKVMFLCVKKCACGQVLVSVRDCFLDKLPKHITPQHTYFHMPLPQNVLFVYSTSFPLLKYSPIFAVNLSAIFAWSDHILRNTSSGCLVWYFTSTKLKYSTTSPSLTF